MRYLMRQKMLCFGDDYTVMDERGNEVYVIDGAAFTIRDSTSFRDMQGREVCHIHRKLLSLGPTYVIERNGRTTTVHKQLFTLFRCKFTVDAPGPNDLEASGNLTDHECAFRDASDHVVATVSKRWFTFRDTYGVEIEPGQDDVMVIAAAVVIDLCCHGDKKR